MKIFLAKNGSPCVIQEIIIKLKNKGKHYGEVISVYTIYITGPYLGNR